MRAPSRAEVKHFSACPTWKEGKRSLTQAWCEGMLAGMNVAAKVFPSPSTVGLERPDVSAIVTEDDTPVDNFASEKQQRLLTEPIYTSWSGPPLDADGLPRTFVAAANVGMFSTPKEPPIVPDVFLSLDVALADDLWEKEHRTYFFWEMGKPPDVVIEVISNREGAELSRKKQRYAQLKVKHYVVWDPQGLYGDPMLRVFELRGNRYVTMQRAFFPSVGLGVALWDGVYEGFRDVWLRWTHPDGSLVATGVEWAKQERGRAEVERGRAKAALVRAEEERERAEEERERAEEERERADVERGRADVERKRADVEHGRAEEERERTKAAQARAEQLAAMLRALGIDPKADS